MIDIHASCDIAGIPRYAADSTEIKAEHRVFAMALALRGRIETAEVNKLREEGIRRALDDSKKLVKIRTLFAEQEAQERGRVDYDCAIRECLKEEP